MSMNQKEAVYSVITTALAEANVEWTPNETIVKDLLRGHPNQRLRDRIINYIMLGFREGQIALKKEYDEERLTSYTHGLVRNWLKKDPRLNGGKKLATKKKAQPEASPESEDQTESEPAAENDASVIAMPDPTSLRALKRDDGWWVMGKGQESKMPNREDARRYVRANK